MMTGNGEVQYKLTVEERLTRLEVKMNAILWTVGAVGTVVIANVIHLYFG
jgi:hypothetical protein